MIKFAVCGDSFFSIDSNHTGKSFSEYLCQQNAWELLSLARPGSSNFAIALQVDKAIEMKADFVIVGATSVNRIELPIEHKSTPNAVLTKDRGLETAYQKERGLSNVQYGRHNLQNFDFLIDPTIVSDVIANILLDHKSNRYCDDLSKDQIQALKMFVTFCYDENIKRQYDSWIISDACRRLLHANIPFLLFYEHMYDSYSEKPFPEFQKDIEWIPSEYVAHINEFSFRRDLPIPNNAEFHYCEKIGGKIWGDYIQSKYSLITHKTTHYEHSMVS